jgi:hypothetical protein
MLFDVAVSSVSPPEPDQARFFRLSQASLGNAIEQISEANAGFAY